MLRRRTSYSPGAAPGAARAPAPETGRGVGSAPPGLRDFLTGETLDKVTEIADEAGQLLLSYWRSRSLSVERKGPADLVTEADLASERLLIDRLTAAFPHIPVVAEETQRDAVSGALHWYVDPLDGTTNFTHGHFVFAVSIGLAYRGEPVLGVVVAPALRTRWSGAQGVGAWRNESPCWASDTDDLGQALLATGFPYDRASSNDINVAETGAMIPVVQGVRRCGAASVDLALVADGTYDGYWEQKLSPWDLCAGAALVLAAGGRVTDYTGQEAELDEGRAIATNGRIHDALAARVREARALVGLNG